jgi:hypothetical protein
MPTVLKTKNSVTTTVAPTSLAQGELAVNITDKKMWVGNAATTPVQLLGAGVTGDVVGPASATDNALARFDATTGKLIQNSIGILSDAGALSGLTALSTGTLSATGVATFSAGTVSLPAITTTGDTNTGIFFPAADTIAFTEGGAESMRIDSSGNVGIGTSSPSSKLTVGGNPPTAGAIAAVGAAAGISLALSDNVNSSLYVRNAAGGPVIGTDAGNALRFATSGNATTDEKMRIDSSGNVGIGTSGPSGRLDVVNTTTPYLNITATAASTAAVLCINATSGGEEAITYQRALRFGTATGVNAAGFAEKMRIDSSGNLLVGTTTSPSGTGQINAPKGVTGTPAFSAYASTTTTLSTGVFAKIGFQTEDFDTNNNFASSRFTPTVAGYYQINACIAFGTSGTAQQDAIAIYKNGSQYQIGSYIADTGNLGLRAMVASLVYCNGSTDYIEIYGIYNAGPATQNIVTGSVNTWFNGSMVRGA